MKRKILVLILVVIVSLMSLSLVGCSSTKFRDITGIKQFDEIEKIVIVYNNNIVEGNVSTATTKTYTEDRDILKIYNIMSVAHYRATDDVKDEISEFHVRIYVKGHTGYIEYSWDKEFTTSKDYDGKVKKGAYSMDDAHLGLMALKDIFFSE